MPSRKTDSNVLERAGFHYKDTNLNLVRGSLLAALDSAGLLPAGTLSQVAPPANTDIFWIDETTDPETLKVHNGTAWVAATFDDLYCEGVTKQHYDLGTVVTPVVTGSATGVATPSTATGAAVTVTNPSSTKSATVEILGSCSTTLSKAAADTANSTLSSIAYVNGELIGTGARFSNNVNNQINQTAGNLFGYNVLETLAPSASKDYTLTVETASSTGDYDVVNLRGRAFAYIILTVVD